MGYKICARAASYRLRSGRTVAKEYEERVKLFETDLVVI